MTSGSIAPLCMSDMFATVTCVNLNLDKTLSLFNALLSLNSTKLLSAVYRQDVFDDGRF